MNEIKCPHCGKAFTVDEAGFSAILSQVRTKEFDSEIQKRTAELEAHLNTTHRQATELRVNQAVSEKNEEISCLTLKIEQLQAELERSGQQFALDLEKSVKAKETEITRLQQQLEGFAETHQAETQAEVVKALSAKNDEITQLKLAAEKSANEKETEITRLKQQLESLKETHQLETQSEIGKAVSEKDTEISRLTLTVEKLRGEIDRAAQQHALTLEKTANEKDREIERLNTELRGQDKEKELAVLSAVAKAEQERDTQKAKYEAELQQQRELVEYYKDFKTRQSTKMVGESLERHCESEFRKIQGYFPPGRVFFGKDNEVVNNSKGDFIYRELDECGNEVISIMFEMKNEMETTATKHKNEDFFKELDKDRKNKKCEYAVLVSLLESDSDYYNQGIVTVSEYDKMYVVRPQCFLTIISILRSAAMSAAEYRQRVAELEHQSIDITHFEQDLIAFKDSFSASCHHAKDRFEDAINDIDKTIRTLQSIKENLRKTIGHFGAADNKLGKLTVKQLTKDNQTMLAMFAELAEERSEPDET